MTPETATPEAPPRIGQLSFDGFPVGQHTVKIAGRSLSISDEQVNDFKLGKEVEYKFTLRVVKSNNHLLSSDDGSHVDHDIIGVMENIERV